MSYRKKALLHRQKLCYIPTCMRSAARRSAESLCHVTPFPFPMTQSCDASPAVVALPAEENLPDDDFWGSSKPKKDKKKKKAVSEWDWGVHPPQRAEQAWEHFTTVRSYQCATPTPSPTLANLNNKTKEYAEVFLSHVRVHMMADYYLIQPLATLALHKLHEILCNFTLHKKRIPDIVALLRFCYEEDEKPVLRELVSAYAACQFRKLWTNMAFRELFVTHPELSVAVVANLVERLD
ncbi:hypothetical protein LMH87_001506 [Akanthomyces muscarius]|uniref:Uncharacterized protein n=1 Tax=Akanthomyces muscarius TaxID=2231603 RepID=A0A9W8Q590_AKAMU|nr:hypothetical protein LMH87_001506 [Akanthomyces muscarius]KAJ4146952.1 hypothetical protein LMH87_001506 [Akanthomyces muscarius]